MTGHNPKASAKRPAIFSQAHGKDKCAGITFPGHQKTSSQSALRMAIDDIERVAVLSNN